jgi:hypothetical protein
MKQKIFKIFINSNGFLYNYIVSGSTKNEAIINLLSRTGFNKHEIVKCCKVRG